MGQSTITIDVKTDEGKVPESIQWKASDTSAEEVQKAKAIMISFWDGTEKTALRIDLWTKDMMVDEMKQFYHQCLLSMADTFDRATGEAEAAKEMRGFAQHFGEKMELIAKKQP